MMGVLDREKIKQGFIQQIAAEGEKLGLVKQLSLEERVKSRKQALDTIPEGVQDIWVFAYGSLMWNPAFHHVDQIRAHIYGYHRSFCLKTIIGRGTSEFPGLILGLEHGGSCHGMALKVDPDRVEEELDVIWSREMVTGAYHPTWVPMKSDGGPSHALTFVMNKEYERYISGLTFEESAQLIAKASGPLGPCSEYLENTVQSLDSLGINDGPMHRLWARVRQIQGA